MSRKPRYFDFHFAEWLAGTRGLGFGAMAVYITVIAIAGDRGGLCPNDASYIAGQIVEPGTDRQARSGATRRTQHALVRLVEMGKLHITTDGQWLTNGRADVELNKVRERINGAHRAGVASGESRRARKKAKISTATSQRHHSVIADTPVSSNSNDLTRTSVRNLQPSYDSESSLTSISTDAARDPAQVGGSGPRASRRETTKERMAALAVIARAKLMGSA